MIRTFRKILLREEMSGRHLCGCPASETGTSQHIKYYLRQARQAIRHPSQVEVR